MNIASDVASPSCVTPLWAGIARIVEVGTTPSHPAHLPTPPSPCPTPPQPTTHSNPQPRPHHCRCGCGYGSRSLRSVRDARCLTLCHRLPLPRVWLRCRFCTACGSRLPPDRTFTFSCVWLVARYARRHTVTGPTRYTHGCWFNSAVGYYHPPPYGWLPDITFATLRNVYRFAAVTGLRLHDACRDTFRFITCCGCVYPRYYTPGSCPLLL